MKSYLISTKLFYFGFLMVLFFMKTEKLFANFITATPANYTSYLGSLAAGDTLFLSSGNYLSNLTLNGRSGTAAKPIVIMGSGNLNATTFQAQSCCNTVSITKCAFLVIKNFQLDGQNLAVDAIKAEGTIGNWAHHITIEYLNIINYGNNQQNVGISTKCSAWNWIVRKNRIIGAGTGMYLGNSDGTRPFVNGIIEYNYIANTIGYNVEIKHQFIGSRDSFPETMVNGKTILRNNVFTKDNTASTGGNARPNVLVGGFPASGWGSQDKYEIYGNLFYNNPVEALFQGTGNILMYENIFVNNFDPSGFRAVYFTPQNGISPQELSFFHNTIWVANTAGGVRVFNPNTSFKQYCYANAVFAASPITNFVDTLGNLTDSYLNAGNHVLSATTQISSLNLYPKSGALKGTIVPSTLFQTLSNWGKDFNNDLYDWTYRGAFSGCCINNGWQLKLDSMPDFKKINIGIPAVKEEESDFSIAPNPFTNEVRVCASKNLEVKIYDLSGVLINKWHLNEGINKLNLEPLNAGVYLFQVTSLKTNKFIRIVKQ